MLLVTVALCVKVLDGIVLAADSAQMYQLATPQTTEQMYYNADKIFHLHPLLPIAAMTFGDAVIAPMAPVPLVSTNVASPPSATSVVSLSKRLCLQLAGQDPDDDEDRFNVNDFRIEQVAERAKRMFAKACAKAAEDAMTNGWPFNVNLGYVVAGVSSGSDQPEALLLKFETTTFEPAPEEILGPDHCGFRAFGCSKPVYRLFDGYDPDLPKKLIDYEVVGRNTPEQEANRIIDALLNQFSEPPVAPGMPLRDAVELARFMVETTKGYERYKIGPDLVGGPVKVASISPDEGFKWHY